MAFQERFVETDGFRIRYWEDGEGPPLLHLHGAGGPHVHAVHGLLARTFRTIVFEMPGFGAEPNERSRTMPDLADTMAAAASKLGLDRFALMGTSFGGSVAVTLAIRHPALVSALVLEAPAAIRPPGMQPPSGSPEEIARRLYAHPDRVPPLPAVPAALAEQRRTLVRRLRGPDRSPELEEAMRGLRMPVLVLFGTRDDVISPDMGRLYKELIPGSHLMFVYDAGHEVGAERPEAFADLVGDFLERDDAFVISRTKTVLLP